MAEQGKNRRWIVLLNKAPKGPFSADEIRELLAQGILRRNDLASAIEETPTKKGEWKLIWQFVEFDRRGIADLTNTPLNGGVAAFNAEKKLADDRRKAAVAEDLRQKALAELPENWKDIQPEDLLPHSTSVIQDTDYEMPADSVNRSIDNFDEPRTRLYFGLGFASIAAIGWFFFHSSTKSGVVVETPKPGPTKTNAAIEVPRRLPAQSRPGATAAAAAPVARPRIPSDANIEDNRDADQGEVDPIEEEGRQFEANSKKTRIKSKRAAKSDREEGEGEIANEEGEEGERDELVAQDRDRDRDSDRLGERDEREPADNNEDEPEEDR